MLLSDTLIRILDLVMLLLSDLKKMKNSVIDKRILEYGGIYDKNKTGGEKFGNYETYY